MPFWNGHVTRVELLIKPSSQHSNQDTEAVYTLTRTFISNAGIVHPKIYKWRFAIYKNEQ